MCNHSICTRAQALAKFLKAKSAERALPLTSIWVQHHSGVANAAPADALTAPLPGCECLSGAAGLGGGLIRDTLCELRFKISPLAFFQVGSMCSVLCVCVHDACMQGPV